MVNVALQKDIVVDVVEMLDDAFRIESVGDKGKAGVHGDAENILQRFPVVLSAAFRPIAFELSVICDRRLVVAADDPVFAQVFMDSFRRGTHSGRVIVSVGRRERERMIQTRVDGGLCERAKEYFHQINTTDRRTPSGPGDPQRGLLKR